MIYLYNYSKKYKKDFKLLKYEEIKKINTLIIPEHDSLIISSLSKILNIDDINENNSNENKINVNDEYLNEGSESEEDKDIKIDNKKNLKTKNLLKKIFKLMIIMWKNKI